MIASPAFGLLLFLLCVKLYNRQAKRANLHRKALVDPENSPWRRLLLEGDDDSFLELTGFTKDAFRLLFPSSPFKCWG